MAAHITYLSEPALHRKFGRNLQDRKAITYGFDADFQVESYLRHQGSTFVDRFDANSYLYITRAMDYFDLAAEHGGVAAGRLPGHAAALLPHLVHQRLAVPDPESRALVHALNAVAANVSFVEIETDKGHDAFLLHEPELFATLARLSDRLRRASRVAAGRRRRAGAPRCLRVARPAAEAATRRAARDLRLIADMIEPGTRVLDIGCGDGALLAYLAREKGVDGRGIELSQSGVNACVRHGLSVIQGDADSDLDAFPERCLRRTSC